MFKRIVTLFSSVRRTKSATRTRLSVELLEDLAVPTSFTAATVAELVATINAANLTTEADSITLAVGKTFTLTTANNFTDGSNGLPVIADGSIISIIGNGDFIERSGTSGTPALRLFGVAAGGSLTLTNLTLQGGEAAYAGGAIFSRGTLNLVGVTVQNNIALGASGADAGYYVPGGDAVGGGVYSSGNLTISGCTIHNNSAVGGRGADGALYHSGFPGSPPPPQPGLPGGSAYGGGVCVAGGTAATTGTTIDNNTARGGAGGRGHKGAGKGANGLELGGGIFIAPLASVSLDPFTMNHTKHNHASTADDNISGTYTVL